MSTDEQGCVLSSVTATLPCDARGPAAARELVRQVLTQAARPEWTESAELACSELVTNAVLHAHTDVELTVEVHADHVCVFVRDSNPVLPMPRDYGHSATTGRGMALVAALADHHGIRDAGPSGKTVWFTVGDAAGQAGQEETLAAWADPEWETQDQVDEPVPADSRDVEVRLLGLPPALWLAARQHHDAILRELVLYLAEHQDVEVDLPATDRARGTISRAVSEAAEHLGHTRSATLTGPDGGGTRDVLEPLDLAIPVAADLGPAFLAMQDTLDAAELLARTGRLLVRPGLPEIIAVRDWACEQVTAQFAGVGASPWPGTAQERFTYTVHEGVGDPELMDWAVALVRDSPRGVVAADEANRIVAVSASLAAFLGWDPVDLVGRRVVTLVPPKLREAHVAGFTRHLTTGESHVLDVPLTLPVLRADGTERAASFLISKTLGRNGRAVYLAWIEPLQT